MSKSENIALYKYLTRPASPQLQDTSSKRQMYGSGRIAIPATGEQQAEALRRFGIPFEQLNVQQRSNIRVGRYSDQPVGGVAKPATKMQEKIAQKVYGKSFDELPTDKRSKIRQGRITINSGGLNMMTTEDRIVYTKKRMQDFVDNFQKERGRLPSKQEIRKIGGFEFGTVTKYIDQGIIQAGEKGATRGLNDPRVIEVNNQLKFLDKNKYVQDSFKKGQLPNLTEVAKILGVKDKSVASYRIGQLASTYLGDREVQGIKPKFKKGAGIIFDQADQEYNRVIRSLADLKIGRSVDEKSIATTKNVIKRAYPEGISEAYAIDEPAGTVSSARRGTSPYGAFGQIIDSEINQGLKYQFDRRKSVLEKSLQDAIESGSDTKIKTAVNKFNNTVSEYETKLNQDVKPGQKRIKLFKVSLDNPEKTIANYSDLPESYQNAFQKNYNTRGYSFKIPSDIKPLSQIADELKIEKNVSKLSSAAAKGGPRIYSTFFPGLQTVAEKGIQPILDLTVGGVKDIARGAIGKGTLKLLPGLGTAYGIYDTGVAFQEGKSVPEMAFRFVGADPIYNAIKEYNRLPEDAQEIQKKVNAQMSFDAEQISGLDEGLVGMSGRPEVTDQEQMYLAEQKKLVKEKIEQENKDRAEGRHGFVEMLKGNIKPLELASGGRVFLEKGGKPINVGRRKFIKLIGQGTTVLASLPFLGKFIKPVAKNAPEVIEAVSRSAENVPTYLMDLIAKVKMMGKSKVIGKPDNPEGFVKYQLGDYEVVDGSEFTRIKKQNHEGEYLKNEVEMQIKKDPETGGIEYEEATAFPDRDGKLKDVDFGIEDFNHEDMKKFTYED